MFNLIKAPILLVFCISLVCLMPACDSAPVEEKKEPPRATTVEDKPLVADAPDKFFLADIRKGMSKEQVIALMGTDYENEKVIIKNPEVDKNKEILKYKSDLFGDEAELRFIFLNGSCQNFTYYLEKSAYFSPQSVPPAYERSVKILEQKYGEADETTSTHSSRSAFWEKPGTGTLLFIVPSIARHEGSKQHITINIGLDDR